MKKPSQQETDPKAADTEEFLTNVPVAPIKTGTFDDEDDSSGEHADEYEAPAREDDDNVEASQEFQYDEEDRGAGND